MQSSQSCVFLTTAYSVRLLLAANTLTIAYVIYGRVGFFASLMGMWANKRVKERWRKQKSFNLWDVAQCQFGLVLRWLDQPLAYENMDLQARTLGWLPTARMLLCWVVFEALVAGILYLLGVQNIPHSQKWSSVSQNQCEARSNHVCKWSELMFSWQKGYCFFAGSWLEKGWIQWYRKAFVTQSEALCYFGSNCLRLCAMRMTVSVNRMAKLLASDAMHQCCQASHQFSKEKLDKEGVVGCKVDL
jgi:hypothetical protein